MYLPDHGVGLAGVAERVRAGEDALRLVEGVAGAAHVLTGGEGELFFWVCGYVCVFVGCWVGAVVLIKADELLMYIPSPYVYSFSFYRARQRRAMCMGPSIIHTPTTPGCPPPPQKRRTVRNTVTPNTWATSLEVKPEASGWGASGWRAACCLFVYVCVGGGVPSIHVCVCVSMTPPAVLPHGTGTSPAAPAPTGSGPASPRGNGGGGMPCRTAHANMCVCDCG